MFVICAIFVFLIRGCYQGNYMVNGQLLDAGTVVKAVSKVTFHVIAAGVMLIAALLSMRVFRRDRDDGMQSCILSKPIARWQYVTGKIIGLWALSVLFMFILHSIVFLITSINLKVVMPEYLIASLLCSFNLLFVVVAVLLLSLLMPDIVAFLCVMGIGVVGFVADGIFAISHSQMAQADDAATGHPPAVGLDMVESYLLFMAKALRRTAVCFFVDWQRSIPWIRIHISTHQCPSLLPYPRCIAFPAFWE